MAYRVIEEEVYVPKIIIKVKDVFAKIGNKFVGVFKDSAEGEYGTDYRFLADAGRAEPVVVTITDKGALKRRLDKAGLSPGDLVAIQYSANVDTGKDNAMRVFKLAVDSDFKGVPPRNAPNAHPVARESAPPPPSDAEAPF
jgi:hypothetical protein